ncbi:MAG: tetrahydrofolate dehydrogenase/cyclohydrolase catalytic domain-containing protein, partial [Thermoleophilia bacterium]
MSAEIIDGKKVSADIRAEVAQAVKELQAKHGLTPGLAVVLVGEDPGSQIYVNNKERACAEVGFNSFKYVLPTETAQ